MLILTPFRDSPVTYQAFNKKLKYIDAVKSCREKGGDIAMPTSFEEDQKILEAAKLVDTGEYWIGVQVIVLLTFSRIKVEELKTFKRVPSPFFKFEYVLYVFIFMVWQGPRYS